VISPTTEDILNAPIDGILTSLSIENWDILIVGDGSGNRHDSPCGWSSILIERNTQNRRVFGGNANAGSITFAEAMPYVQALQWYDQLRGQDILKTTSHMLVHIVTDSQVVAITGNDARDLGKRPARTRLYLTSYLQELARARYKLHWHWARRESSELNKLCDALSRRHRLSDPSYEKK